VFSRACALLLLTASLAAHASPPRGEEEPRPGPERLIGRLEQAGQNVIEQAATVRHQATGLVVHALGFLGVPYRRGGESAATGFDCSGFVRAIYEQTFGLVLPRRANEQAAATQAIERSELQPGDLVFFNTMRRAFSHVGIYVGEGKFIHAPRAGAQVRVESMATSYWVRRFDGARRVTDGEPAR
jgi:cell wall-associated NlpC family hydrolase